MSKPVAFFYFEKIEENPSGIRIFCCKPFKTPSLRFLPETNSTD